MNTILFSLSSFFGCSNRLEMGVHFVRRFVDVVHVVHSAATIGSSIFVILTVHVEQILGVVHVRVEIIHLNIIIAVRITIEQC